MRAVWWWVSWPAAACVKAASWFWQPHIVPRVDPGWAEFVSAAAEHRREQNRVDDAAYAMADMFTREGERARATAETGADPVTDWTASSGLKNTYRGSRKRNS